MNIGDTVYWFDLKDLQEVRATPARIDQERETGKPATGILRITELSRGGRLVSRDEKMACIADPWGGSGFAFAPSDLLDLDREAALEKAKAKL